MGWVAKCLKEGSGGIRKWVQRELKTEEKGVHRDGIFTAALADIVERDFNSWKEIWEKLKRWESMPWKGDQAPKRCVEDEASPKFGAKELRKATAAFSARPTRVGASTIWVLGSCGGCRMNCSTPLQFSCYKLRL